MTGPEHYQEAERLIACDDFHEPPTAGNIALAQVHATLALAAATAANDPDPEGRGQMTEVSDEWADVIMPAEGGDRS